MIAAASVSSFLAVRDLGYGLGVARTGATVVATCLSLAVLAALARPLLSWRGAMVLALAGAFAALFALPWLRHQLALTVLPAEVLWPCVAIAAVGFVMLIALWAVLHRVTWLRRLKALAAGRLETEPGGSSERRVPYRRDFAALVECLAGQLVEHVGTGRAALAGSWQAQPAAPAATGTEPTASPPQLSQTQPGTI